MKSVLMAGALALLATPALAQSNLSVTGTFGAGVTANQGAAPGQFGVGVVLGTSSTTVVSTRSLFSSTSNSTATALGTAFAGGSYNVGVQSGKPVNGTFAVNLPVSIGFGTP